MREKRLIKSETALANKLFKAITPVLQKAREDAIFAVNSSLLLRNWHVGQMINKEILSGEKARYGKKVVSLLSAKLLEKFSGGFDVSSLFRMIKFTRYFPREEKVVTLSPFLTWSHIVVLVSIENDLQRDFYTEFCRLEKWNVRALRKKIDGMLYERTAIAKKPEKIAKKAMLDLKSADKLTPDLILRDPYFLKFTGLKGDYSESDLENAILNELEKFIKELGSDFCFIDRQKRMSTEQTDRYLDLLFFHRRMRRLVAIELKLGKFDPANKGQMEWYLQWLDKHERREGEDKPLGIILCAYKDQEDVEYLLLNESGIHVAQYLTELPNKKLLEEKLHQAIKLAKEKYENEFTDIPG